MEVWDYSVVFYPLHANRAIGFDDEEHQSIWPTCFLIGFFSGWIKGIKFLFRYKTFKITKKRMEPPILFTLINPKI